MREPGTRGPGQYARRVTMLAWIYASLFVLAVASLHGGDRVRVPIEVAAPPGKYMAEAHVHYPP